MKKPPAHLATLGTFAALLLAVSPGDAQLKLNVDPLPRFEPNVPPNVRQAELPPALPQLPLPPVIRPPNRIIFNEGQVFGGGVRMNGAMPANLQPVSAVDAGQDEKPDPAEPHRLEFTDGTALRGNLETLEPGRKELTWRPADASRPLVIPTAQVSRLAFGGGAKPDEVKVHALIKLTGNDWIGGNVSAMQGNKIQMKLADGSPLAVDRDRVEWIYFSENGAPECYDGPTSLSGFDSAGNWTFRDGALRATNPGMISRQMEQLPDLVEYFFDINQGTDECAFRLGLHTLRNPSVQFQIMLMGRQLQLIVQGDGAKMEVVDLGNVPGLVARRKSVQVRVLEDHPGGRLLVFLDGRKAAEWSIAKGKAGGNRGGFNFQPMAWSSNTEQTISRIRIIPWDGRVPAENAAEPNATNSDQVSLIGGERKQGQLVALTADKLKLSTSSGVVDLPRTKVALLRLRRPEKALEEEAPAARVWLAPRGEFDAAAVTFRGGKLGLRTHFGGEMVLALSAVRSVVFTGASWIAPKSSDILVFRNGDQVRGALEAVAESGTVRWRMGGTDAPVDFKPPRLAGLLLTPRAEKPAEKAGVLARFRNGDFLSGRFVSLDKEQVILDTAEAGPLTIARAHLQTLYFAANGQFPVLDGATNREAWERGGNLVQVNSAVRVRKSEESSKTNAPSPWRYFDGAYTLVRRDNRQPAGNTGPAISLGRVFEGMPSRVEISFDVSSSNPMVTLNARLFAEANNPGYSFQLYSHGVHLYDQGPRVAGRGLVQQQFPFAGKITPLANQRRIRLLADRLSGKVTIMVDDVVLGQFGPKTGARNLGNGLTLLPQYSCTLSNLWIAPWDGQVPGRAPAPGAAPPDAVLLANGDEARGNVEGATSEVVKVESELGLLELPTERMTMVELGGETPKRSVGARLRFANRGALTVKTWRIESGKVVCQTELAGPLTLPLDVVQEVVFAVPASESAAPKDGSAKPAP